MFPAVTDLIPHRPPFLFVDAIVSESPGGIAASRTWRAEEAFYQGHYPDSPITPGVLLCEAVFQTACLYVARSAKYKDREAGALPMIVKIEDVRFRNPVYPGETTLMEVREKETFAGFTMLSGSVTSGGKRVLTVDFSVTWRRAGGAA